MLYSVRMRAAQGGAHEQGGTHISGAERIVCREELAAVTAAMQERALTHSRGQADFINIKVEAIAPETVHYLAALRPLTRTAPELGASRALAQAELYQAGVSPAASQAGLKALAELSDSMRGAMLLCAQTGRRLDGRGNRGVRVSRMDISEQDEFTVWLLKQGLSNIHTREALVLATKVAAAEGVVAEVCWSDDPDYTTGYVASKAGYVRLPNIKPLGLPQGGRVFFIAPDSDIAAIISYLEQQPVLVTVPDER